MNNHTREDAMKLEEALDLMIFGYEDYRHEDDPDNGGFAQAWETILRCADREWQHREIYEFTKHNMIEDENEA